MKKKIVGIFICTLLIATAIPVVGQLHKIPISNDSYNKINPVSNSDKWIKTYGDEQFEIGVSAQQTSDGGYIVLGLKGKYYEDDMDFWLIKTDSSGNKIWDKKFLGDDNDRPTSLEITSDGGYIMVGGTDLFGADRDILLIKTDSEGNKIWDKTFGGSEYDVGFDVEQTNDGGYIVIGFTNSYSGEQRDMLLIKTDSEGNKIWDKTFGKVVVGLGYSVQQTTDGGYIILGETHTDETLQDMWLIKTDSNGEMQWNKIFGGTGFDFAGSVQQTTDGGYIVLGSYQNDLTFLDIWAIKTDTNGDVIWDRTFSIIGKGHSVQQTSDGGYIILGDIFGGLGENALLIKTDGNGQELWRRTFGGPYNDVGYSIQQTIDGGYIVTGEYSPGLLKDPDIWLIKTDSNGNVPRNRIITNTFFMRFLEQFPLLQKLLLLMK